MMEIRLKSTLLMMVLIAAMLLSGCSSFSSAALPAKLDREKIAAEGAAFEERQAYYAAHVDKPLGKMSEDEKAKCYVNVKISYKDMDAYEGDVLSFLRTDNELLGSIRNSEDELKLAPGIYKVISRFADAELGEIELLEPGAEVSIKVDYRRKRVSQEAGS